MAYVINPDGTISTIETTHDQYGNLKPKIDSEALKEQEIHYSNYSVSKSSGKGSVYPKSTGSSKHINKKNVGRAMSATKQQAFITADQINKFFKNRILSGKWLDFNEYKRIKDTLSDKLQILFASKYKKYLEQVKAIKELNDSMKRKTFKKPKDKKRKNKIKTHHQVKEVKVHHNSHTGYTIGEIAKFGSLKGEYASSSDFDVRTSNPPRPARAPKYAYARDRYGRVQERDSFNEEKKNEFYVAQNQQRNYDYSSYDADDDHDGAYSGFE